MDCLESLVSIAQGWTLNVLHFVFSWFGPRPGPSPSTESLLDPKAQQLDHIAEEFHYYIRNHIPARLIDTSSLSFVERSDVFGVFSAEIAQITEDDVQRKIGELGLGTDPELGYYVCVRKRALQEIMRDVVRYAIFSHRWTDSEPTHQHLSALAFPGSLARQRNRKTAGFAKLLQLCDTARALGYKFVWSDTCCIDKTNTAELNEAINAMFKWYANAHLCIVHLAGSSSLKGFEGDLWFTRGWTLQELLAPRQIKFYDATWHPFTTLANDKDDLSLMSALSSVTRVPRDVIIADNSRGIKGRDVWEIMSWAATRRTTRIEDAAYCLFGLFNVHPPIAYGEGEKAFPKLVEAIAARNQTWDVFAWCGQASERHPALPSSPACYPSLDEAMVRDGAGMSKFTLTARGLRLESVPLIPMVLASESRNSDQGLYTVTLSPRPDMTKALGAFGDVTVLCGSGRLRHVRKATDLNVCILNYKPNAETHRGELQVGRTYVCFLLYMNGPSAEGPAWLKVTTDNLLRITCRGTPSEGPGKGSSFDLSLTTTYIRGPHAQSTIRT